VWDTRRGEKFLSVVRGCARHAKENSQETICQRPPLADRFRLI